MTFPSIEPTLFTNHSAEHLSTWITAKSTLSFMLSWLPFLNIADRDARQLTLALQ